MSDILDDHAAASGSGDAPEPTSNASSRAAGRRPAVWQSLAEYEGRLDENVEAAADFLGREFPTDDFDQIDGVDRRRFFQILGASAALAGASSCRWQKENILPYTERPEETVPGKPKHYASVMDLAGAARPVSVTSYDGRPVKVEPNTNVGVGTDVYGQAEVLGFYDPDRARRVGRNNGDGTFAEASWDDALEGLRGVAEGSVAVLASTHSSPTLARLAGEMSQAGVRWVWWSPVGQDNAVEGARLAFGRPARARYDLTKADVVVALDCDFQRAHPDAVRLAHDFATRRMPEDTDSMSRLYAIESRFTSTGVTSDHRLPVRSADAGAVLELLEAKLKGAAAGGARAKELAANDKVAAFIEHLAADISAAGGRFAILPGESQGAAVHARVHGIHASQGAMGTTVEMIDEPLAEASNARLRDLVSDMNQGNVKRVLILGGNPVYDAPADLDFAAAMANCETTAHLSLYRDETSNKAGWALPMAHWLECWGDARSWDGQVHVAQPLIRPLFDGKSAIELCALLLGREPETNEEGEVVTDLGRAEVRATHAELDEAAYRKAIHDGVVEGTRAAALSLQPQSNLPAIEQPSAGTEVTFFPCPKVFDGRFANNGWLQELPDFTTKMTWDNAALIGVATARAMGVTTGDMVEIQVGGRTLEAGAYVAPGQAEDSIAISLGYGREHAGQVAGFPKVGVDVAGFNAYALRGTDAMHAGTGTVSKASGRYSFATTQEHHLIDEIGMQGRRERLHKLVMETDAETYAEHPDHFEHVYHVPKRSSLFDQKEYTGQHQWGMTIDLSTCNGCNACVIACQAENNIPIVGKEQVKRGREMHWMRVDLYYQGDAEDASTMDAVNQPINCLQCENAPCEQVCPVAATVHGEEGTNDMVYNRCIGTRYCGNNCPVKVRRFNYFHYTKYMDEPEQKLLQLGQNPNVTVRSRGVMEKCTYCMQRISEARIVARNEGRKIRDGEVITACQASCPTEAITFGDISDPDSAVSKKQALNRDYSMLAELGIRPRTQYLARISNPKAELVAAMPQGLKGREDWEELKEIVEPHHGGHGEHGSDAAGGGDGHGGDDNGGGDHGDNASEGGDH